MKLTVLGIWGGYPKAKGACPGYLLCGDGYKVLLDCGSGVVSRLNQVLSFQELDAVLCSHLHLDHVSDLYVLRYGYYVKKQEVALPKLPIYTPTDRLPERNLIDYKDTFELMTLSKDTVIEIGSARFTFFQTKHGAETYAIRVEANEKTFVYSADTGYDSALASFAKDADLLLCESTFLEEYKRDSIAHCSAVDAGKLATEANAKKLLLTHFWYELEPCEYLRECQASYPNLNVGTAKEMQTYFI